MVFRCQQCGECCSYMGDIIGIEAETGAHRFRIRFSVTVEEMVVTLDADKQELFYTQDIRPLRPMACPFLRFDIRERHSVLFTRPAPDSAGSTPASASLFLTRTATLSVGYRRDRASFPR